MNRKLIVAPVRDLRKSDTFPGRVYFRVVCPHCNMPENTFTTSYVDEVKEKTCVSCNYEFLIKIYQ